MGFTLQAVSKDEVATLKGGDRKSTMREEILRAFATDSEDGSTVNIPAMYAADPDMDFLWMDPAEMYDDDTRETWIARCTGVKWFDLPQTLRDAFTREKGGGLEAIARNFNTNVGNGTCRAIVKGAGTSKESGQIYFRRVNGKDKS